MNRTIKRLYRIAGGFGFLFCAALIVTGCREQTPASLFTELPADSTHIHFENRLTDSRKFNIYTYRDYYNGGGVALGDINNDGLIDIFFTGNMVESRLYLNKGNFQFEDITEKAGITKKGKWSTGVTMADVNGDGLLDIYVCNSGNIKGDNRENELYINQGNLTFKEEAKAYGLADAGYSTHAAFFDYDHDGDLDMFLLNNSFKAIGSINITNNERNVRDSLGGDKLFRNDGGHFTDVSAQAGIYGSLIGFGLGVTVGDVNGDGWDDIYVSNDFFERDYLYINNRNGTFSEQLEQQMHSISNTSMGADMADINNDGRPEVFVTEMLPERQDRLKMNTQFENWDKYQIDIKSDYHHQFTRNTLQLNNGDGTFSEIGRYAGVHATDWSWGALLTDLDNDGFKDIYVTNGIYRDITNGDFLQYTASPEFYQMANNPNVPFEDFIKLIPSTPLPNYAFHNNGDLTFTDKAASWGLATPSFSNGAAYGDLDNDGDLDLVVNNVNMPCFIYRNEARQQHPENKFLKVKLQGEGQNRFGVGARVTVYYNHTLSYQEAMPVKGFQSTVDNRLNFGLGKAGKIDSVVVIWNDGRQNVLHNIQPNSFLTVRQSDAVQPLKNQAVSLDKPLFRVAAGNTGIDFRHKEDDFNDFHRDKLIYHMLSTPGPRMAKADVNGDGLEDFYICGAKGASGALYVQKKDGHFLRTNTALFEQDAGYEDTDCVFFDADGDGDQDLYVCSGGSEWPAGDTNYKDRLYLNDGRGNFHRSEGALPKVLENTSCVRAGDYDGDGDMDLFVGIRSNSGRYGEPCNGYIFQNNGKGMFTNITNIVAPGLKDAGMITDGAWVDFNHDGKLDLVVTGEYMPIRIFLNRAGHLTETTTAAGLSFTNGWWNRIHIADVNGDGYPDIIAGNHGLNSRFKAGREKPLQMYVGDFDSNGSVEQIITSYSGDTAYPLCTRQDLMSVIPTLKKKYLTNASFIGQTMQDIFSQEQLTKARCLQVYELRSCVFINNRNGTFTEKPLPGAAQFSPIYGIVSGDFDGDGKTDLVIAGNLYEAKPEVGIYDANYGLMLKGDGSGNFTVVDQSESGIHVIGTVRDLMEIRQDKKRLLLFALNNDPLQVFELKGRH